MSEELTNDQLNIAVVTNIGESQNSTDKAISLIYQELYRMYADPKRLNKGAIRDLFNELLTSLKESTAHNQAARNTISLPIPSMYQHPTPINDQIAANIKSFNECDMSVNHE